MLNRYQWWKNLIVVAVLLIGGIYAVPNLFGEDPAVQVSQQRGAEVGEPELRSVQAALDRGGVATKSLYASERAIAQMSSDSSSSRPTRSSADRSAARITSGWDILVIITY